jgi:pilus assembly protein CpaB
MVLPEDAERIALASNEGKITLALRNPLDVATTDTKGVRLAGLMRGVEPEPVIDPVKHKVVARKPAPAPAPPPVYTVETIRAAKRSAEVVQ